MKQKHALDIIGVTIASLTEVNRPRLSADLPRTLAVTPTFRTTG